MKIFIGAGTCGLAAGAGELEQAAEAYLLEKQKEGRSETQLATVQRTGCVGLCWLEPIVDVIDASGNEKRYVQVTPEQMPHILSGQAVTVDIKSVDNTILNRQKRIVMRNYGKINPEDIQDYIQAGGYKAARACLLDKTPEQVINTVKQSGLRGRGGAGFPTWFKWQAAARQTATPKYLVCNADEGDPGAFMDRSVLEGDPHSLIEGMLIGAYAMGAQYGVVYVRAEYPLAIERLQIAIEQAVAHGLLGRDIFGVKGLHFDLRIKVGAGAFVCGEETALIASLEGQRGMPRLKPPFPAEKGLWDQPTNINNVETFANIPWIMQSSAEAFAALGTPKSKGTKVFALTGKINHGGLVEIPMGLPLRTVIEEIGGGVPNGKALKAVQMGGPSGGCIPVELLDTPVDYESITATGAIVGSGGMVVMDEDNCMVEMARFFLDFTCKESCGKCTYCRVGTRRMLEILTRITAGAGRDGDIELLEELSHKIKEGSLCGLGQTAPNPVLTTLKYFRHEYEAHIQEGHCPAGQCEALVSYSIEADKCIGCTRCHKVCPAGAVSGAVKQAHRIDSVACVKCGACLAVCKPNAITVA